MAKDHLAILMLKVLIEAQAHLNFYLSRSHTNLATVILPGYNTLGIRAVSTKSLLPSNL
jgi:hypothetical protein